MANITVNKSKMLKAIQGVISDSLYSTELINQPGLALEDALVLSGDPIEYGEQEIDAINKDILLGVEAYLETL